METKIESCTFTKTETVDAAELAALRKDADRYRKLVATGKYCRASFGGGWGLAMGGKAEAKDVLDAAADALPAVGAA